MKIVTLTLNSAFDIHCSADNFRAGYENFAEITSVEAGGKGVNLSRALVSGGVENIAVVLVGRDNGEEFLKSLIADGLTLSPVWIDGRIRENITIHEDGKKETRLSFSGFTCNAHTLESVISSVGDINDNTVITFTGSIPHGIGFDKVIAMLDAFKGQGAKVVVDSRSVPLEALLALKPWLIKPNKDEAENYTGKKITSVSDAAQIAKTLYDGGISNVMISLGELGAVLACDDGVLYAKTPLVNAISTIGAGDSSIAGFIAAAYRGATAKECLKTATAYGTSACLRGGTLPPLAEDVADIKKQVEIKMLDVI